jgi:sodium/potassium-transporting ATPase subunit alpha
MSTPQIHRLSAEEVFHVLGARPEGLTEPEAAHRQEEFGPNRLREAARTPWARRLMANTTHFLALLLWGAAGLAFLSESLHPGEGMAFLGWAIVAVILINAGFTWWQEQKAERAMAALQRLLPRLVTVRREGRVRQIPAEEVVPGDCLLLNEGDRVPADGRLVEAHQLQVNLAALTGESEPLRCRAEPVARGELLESPNVIFAGTGVVAGSGVAVAFATGMQTEFGKIAHLTTQVEPELTPLQREIVKVTRMIGALATAMGIVFFALGWGIGRSFWENFLFAVGILVANVPEGLLPTVTLSLAMGAQRLAKKRAVVKQLTSVETLGCATVICTDKTGTLTQNRMAVVRAYALGEILDREQPARPIPVDGLWSHWWGVLSLCGNARIAADGEETGDPTEIALLRWAREEGRVHDLPRLGEFLFDVDRKRMTTLHPGKEGSVAYVKGALEAVLPRCAAFAERGGIAPLDEARRAAILRTHEIFARRALRVLALAYRNLPPGAIGGEAEAIERDLVFLGLVGLFDPLRPEAPEAVARCHQAGIRVIMITGDSPVTACAVAEQVGLGTSEGLRVLEGKALDRLTDQEIRPLLRGSGLVLARMLPRHKLRVVTLLKETGEVVAVTGDGVNDAPALKRADIGIAMGIAGTQVAKEAADVVLLDDNFATIVAAIEEGRAVYANIRKFVTYIFASNVPEIVPYLAFILFRIPLPLTIIQILAVDLGTDMMPALALGAEPPDPRVMQEPPRSRQEHLLNLPLLARAYLFLGPIEAAAGMLAFFWVMDRGGWAWGEGIAVTNPLYLQATTACLAAIVVSQVGNVFACRSGTTSAFRLGWMSNPWIWRGIAVELGLLVFIAYHPWGQRLFGTAPLDGWTWLILLPWPFILLGAEEIRKAAVKLRNGKFEM